MMIDRVLRVATLPRVGETVVALSSQSHAGGKGANQAAAAARYGARVRMLGRTGSEGEKIVDALRDAGVDSRSISTTDAVSGNATVIVSDLGENAIVISPESNTRLSMREIESFLSLARAGECMLVQNECSCLAETIALASSLSLRVWLNAAPAGDLLRSLPLEQLCGLIVNEHEAFALTGASEPHRALELLASRVPNGIVLLTLGARGALAASGAQRIAHLGFVVDAIDTVGCGDAFVGVFLASVQEGAPLEIALARANAAGALTATRRGAMESLPSRAEVDAAAAFPAGTRLVGGRR